MEGIDEVFDNLTEEAAEAQEPVQEEVKADPVVEEVQEPVVEAREPEVPQEREDKSVPLATFLDMRDRLKEAERRASELEAARQKAQPQAPAPDFYDMKPEEVSAYVEQVAEQKATQTRFMMSESWAKRNHGADVVEAATAWASERASKDPTFVAQYMSEADPVDFIVRQHKQEVDLTDYRNDPLAFARRILEASGQQLAPTVTQPAVKPAAPPRSIASDATPATPATVDPVAEFNAIFDRK